MRKDQVDQGLNFKKRARRRLVGAIALVLLMVIILPMLLEDREKVGPSEEVEIVMPTTELTEDIQGLETVTEQEVAVGVDASTEEVVELVLPEVVPQPTAPAPKEKTVVEPKKKEVVKKPEPVAKTAPAPKPKTLPKPAAAPSSDRFYVQIGVFSDPGNVKKLKVKLEELGYRSITEKVTTDNGVKTRLRTEAFNGRNEAAIALENIKDQGLTGMVVNQK